MLLVLLNQYIDIIPICIISSGTDISGSVRRVIVCCVGCMRSVGVL